MKPMSEKSDLIKIMVLGLDSERRIIFIRKIADHISEMTKSTLGVDFGLKNFKLEIKEKTKDIGIQIWGMNDESRFKGVRELFLPGTQGIIFCVSKGDAIEIRYLNDWIEDINTTLDRNVPIILIRITKDLKERLANKNRENIEKFMKSSNINNYYEISTVTGENIEKAFEVIAKLSYEHYITWLNRIYN